MLYREIVAFFSEIHTKHINTMCGQKVELLKVKPLFKHKELIFYSILGVQTPFRQNYRETLLAHGSTFRC